MEMSNHANNRVRQRNIDPSLIHVVVAHGTLLEPRGDRQVYVLGRKIVERMERQLHRKIELLRRAKGMVVVTAEDNVIVTAYYN